MVNVEIFQTCSLIICIRHYDLYLFPSGRNVSLFYLL
jgi:hypothetical protein